MNYKVTWKTHSISGELCGYWIELLTNWASGPLNCFNNFTLGLLILTSLPVSNFWWLPLFYWPLFVIYTSPNRLYVLASFPLGIWLLCRYHYYVETLFVLDQSWFQCKASHQHILQCTGTNSSVNRLVRILLGFMTLFSSCEFKYDSNVLELKRRGWVTFDDWGGLAVEIWIVWIYWYNSMHYA